MLMTKETNNAIAATKNKRDCNGTDLHSITILLTWLYTVRHGKYQTQPCSQGLVFFPNPEPEGGEGEVERPWEQGCIRLSKIPHNCYKLIFLHVTSTTPLGWSLLTSLWLAYDSAKRKHCGSYILIPNSWRACETYMQVNVWLTWCNIEWQNGFQKMQNSWAAISKLYILYKILSLQIHTKSR